MKTYRFKDIPLLTRDGNYRVNVPWRYLERSINQFSESRTLEMDPDFQRAHVWTEQQQTRYVEFRLRGGKSGREILFNAPGFARGFSGPMVLVDGKQRLQAVLRFLKDEILAFGSKFSEFTDKMSFIDYDFIFVVNDLKTRAEVLQWYIDLNAGGVAHTEEDIAKVKALLEKENIA